MQVFIVDEANFIPSNCYDGLLPHAQKRGGKLIFTSSSAGVPMQEKGNTTNLDVLRETPGVLFASVTYVCYHHITEFVAQLKRTTCNCFVHLEPFHVDNNAADRSVADCLNDATGRDIGYLLDRGVSRNVLIARGIDQTELPLLLNSTISNMLANAVDTYAMSGTNQLDTSLFVYVDTCAHLSPYSKNGISVCSRYMNSDGTWVFVVLAVDHCYHVSPVLEHVSMFRFVPDLVLKILSAVCLLHPDPNDKTRTHFTQAYIAFEYNSYDLTDTIKNLQMLLNSDRPAMLSSVKFWCLYHKARGEHVFCEQSTIIDPLTGNKTACHTKPGFVMGMHKTKYFTKAFDLMRTGNVMLCQSLTSIYMETSGNDSLHDVVMENLSNIHAKQKNSKTIYTGKGKGRQDDLAVSIIMSIYISFDKAGYIWKLMD